MALWAFREDGEIERVAGTGAGPEQISINWTGESRGPVRQSRLRENGWVCVRCA